MKKALLTPTQALLTPTLLTADSDDEDDDLPELLYYSLEDEEAVIAFYREVDEGIFNIIVVEKALEKWDAQIAALGWRPQGVDAPLTPGSMVLSLIT